MKSNLVANATSVASGMAIAYRGMSAKRHAAPALTPTSHSTTAAVDHLTVVAPAEYGSFGDEGLVLGTAQACVETGASMRLIAPGETKPWTDQGLTTVTSESGQLNPLGLTWKKLTPEVVSGRTLAVLGADSIDAVYGVRTVSRRVSLLNDWARSGGRSSLVNFSLKKSPSANALRLLRQLDSDVELWARDLNSQRRAESFLQREVQVAPDIAMFMASKLDESVADAHIQTIHAKQASAPVVGLVVNAHFNSWSIDLGMPLSDYFKAIVVPLASQGIHVMLIAHDIRTWPGDIELIDQIVKDIGVNPYVHRVVPSSARAAKALISHLDLCITSRMHAGVAALSSGVPAIGLDYVDKFTGQFEWYGAQSNVIPWLAAIDASVVTQMADGILTNAEVERTRLVNIVSRLRAVTPEWVPRI